MFVLSILYSLNFRTDLLEIFFKLLNNVFTNAFSLYIYQCSFVCLIWLFVQLCIYKCCYHCFMEKTTKIICLVPVKPWIIRTAFQMELTDSILILNRYIFYRMASKPINIRWIRTGSRPYRKSFIASFFRQFSTNTVLKIIKIRGKLSIILYDKLQELPH